jgi:peptidoglycan/xylan/chitin deacetylase (PgdA/CDA1 family)
MISLRTTVDLAVTSIAVAATAATVVHAALSPQSQLFGRTLIAGNDPKEIALTYDDGPNDAATLDLLNLLARHNARATFFMIGKFVRQRPDIARAVHAAGHLVANHTMTHPWLSVESSSCIREELRGCNEALEDVLGAPVRYVRFPHGARRPATLQIARELNLTPVQWNAMAFDWKPLSPERMLALVAGGMRRNLRHGRGSNILLHDGFDQTMGADRSATLQVTRRLLEDSAHESRRIVTVDAWA